MSLIRADHTHTINPSIILRIALAAANHASSYDLPGNSVASPKPRGMQVFRCLRT
jgi:hypothetical protein